MIHYLFHTAQGAWRMAQGRGWAL